MERTVPCITCQRNLLDTGKLTADGYFAVCTVCQAHYQVVPLVNEDGHPRVQQDGTQEFYLNPVQPGRAEFSKQEKKPDFSELLKKIQSAKSPNDLA